LGQFGGGRISRRRGGEQMLLFASPAQATIKPGETILIGGVVKKANGMLTGRLVPGAGLGVCAPEAAGTSRQRRARPRQAERSTDVRQPSRRARSQIKAHQEFRRERECVNDAALPVGGDRLEIQMRLWNAKHFIRVTVRIVSHQLSTRRLVLLVGIVKQA